jgi:hypothetical protein
VKLFLFVGVLLALAAPRMAAAELALGSSSVDDGWVVRVSLEAPSLGPVEVSLTQPRPAPVNEARSWLEHELVLRNGGPRAITFADTRVARLLPRLLAADEGCGYGFPPLESACLTYLDIPTLDPGESDRRTITLWKGLPGMKPLVPGTYVFRKVVHFQATRKPPAAGEGRRAVLRIVYRVQG